MNLRLLLLLLLLVLSTNISFSQNTQAVSQDSIDHQEIQYWKKGGSINMNFNQVGLSNWVGGGQSSISTGLILDLFAKYENENMTWDNKFRGAYGLMRVGDRNFATRKTDDVLDLQSRYSRKINNNFSVSGLIHLWSQFDRGYRFERVPQTDQEARIFISEIFAPGFLQALIGYTYQRSAFSLTLSPLTGKTTFVLNDSLSNLGAFGVQPGEKVRFEGGASFIGQLRKQITENISIQSNLNLFANYGFKDPIDVNWETLIRMKVHKYINTTISTHLIFDKDINPEVQFKHVLNVGFEYKF
jgi:hypothetical protein